MSQPYHESREREDVSRLLDTHRCCSVGDLHIISAQREQTSDPSFEFSSFRST
jgi:hypothetical protein